MLLLFVTVNCLLKTSIVRKFVSYSRLGFWRWCWQRRNYALVYCSDVYFCVCTYIHLYIRTYTSPHTYIDIYIYARMHTHTHIETCEYTGDTLRAAHTDAHTRLGVLIVAWWWRHARARCVKGLYISCSICKVLYQKLWYYMHKAIIRHLIRWFIVPEIGCIIYDVLLLWYMAD